MTKQPTITIMLRTIKTLTMFLITAVVTISVQAQPSLEEAEKILQQKITDVTALIYKGQTTSYAELMAEDAVIPFFDLTGKDAITKALTRLNIPPTDYTINFSPLVKLDANTYVTSYTIIETSGFRSVQSEIWKFVDGEFKIAVAHMIPQEPPVAGGISKFRFFLSSLFLGLFLFLLFIILKNARSWKRK